MSNRLLVEDLSRMELPKLEDEKQNHTSQVQNTFQQMFDGR